MVRDTVPTTQRGVVCTMTFLELTFAVSIKLRTIPFSCQLMYKYMYLNKISRVVPFMRRNLVYMIESS